MPRIYINKEITQMDKSRKKIIKEEARRWKAIAVEKYKAGDLAEAKEFAVKARNLVPKLRGLRRLNAVLDVHIAFEKKLPNGDVDWYGILSVDPTDKDLGRVCSRYGKLAKAIVFDNDDTVGGIDVAQKIIADAFRHVAKEKTNENIARTREEAQPSSRVRVRNVEPPLRVTGPVNQLRLINGGGSKRKGAPSTNLLRVPQLRRTSVDAGIRRETLELTPNAFVDKGKSLVTYVSTSQHMNIGAAEETETLQDSEIVNEEDPYMSVPDPDFYNFDKDRMETSFGENQVWAAYDEYGMPRFYALVHRVVSLEPFKLCVSWLHTKKNDELGPMKWIESGYHKTSGNFSVGKRCNTESLNAFSHKVQYWSKGARGLVHIYPKKGNVWALYTNWSPSWKYSTSLEVMNVFTMVEVLQDFDEDQGTVTVARLVKLPGFQNVFCRHPNPKTYPRKELFRFSHQVVSRLLTGKEGKDAPRGCLELDPAALSPELLKVFTEEEAKKAYNKRK